MSVRCTMYCVQARDPRHASTAASVVAIVKIESFTLQDEGANAILSFASAVFSMAAGIERT